MIREDESTVAARLAGASLLVTGASGFLGKAVLATWLREVPDSGPVLVALRAADDDAARQRLLDGVLTSDVFGPFDGGELEAAVAEGRLRAVAVDLVADDLGGLDPAVLAGVDVVIHCAASVSFEQPLDEMIELNVRGPLRLLDALDRSGGHPHVVHVSTAYAAGRRVGLVPEVPSGQGPGEPWVDRDAELAAARAWRRDLDVVSRQPEHERRFVADAREELGPSGNLRVGAQAELNRLTWIARQLTERGCERARALGWSDTYTMSKALAERALVARGRGRLSIVRPSVIESALRTPYPGWLEGLKVADPIILAYGRGLISRFPGEPSARFDAVPVDLVANACVAAGAHPRAEGLRLVTVASGARNPIRAAEVVEQVTSHFRRHPLPDEDGIPVEIPEWRFQSRDRVVASLRRGERALALGRRLLERMPLPGSDEAERWLHRNRRRVERLRRLLDVYGPYVELDCVFSDREARVLADELAPEDRVRLSFDPAQIDWTSYLQEAHLPAVRRLVSTPRPARRTGPRRAPALADGPPALAFFDVDGVVLDSTIAHAYAWLRTRSMPHPDRELWLAAFGATTPGLLTLDRRSRADLLRRFYERYRDLSPAELRAEAHDVLSEFVAPRVQQGAVRRIRAHRTRGDRVVLLTGALDFLVEPLRHLADELVAARLLEHDGAFTGELADPPMTAEGRVAVAAQLAAERGVELAHCHAYGDGISDLPLLEAVGHPHAVNPDFRLAREARRRRWPVEEWSAEPGRRTAPLAPA